MATWVIAGGFAALVLILAGAVILVLLVTRGETDDDVHLPRFRRFGTQGSEDEPDRPDPD